MSGSGMKLRPPFSPSGTRRKAGEEWLVRASGAYMPSIDEEIVERVSAHTITERDALMLRAKRDFVDVYGVGRRAGEEWLVTPDLSSQHICDVDEEVVRTQRITTLSNRQWCVVGPVARRGRRRAPAARHEGAAQG